MQHRQPRLPLILVAAIGVVLAPLALPPADAGDALTQHYDNARTGAVLDETMLNAGTVNPTSFGKLWRLYADGQVVAQPLYVSGLRIDTSGNANVPLVQGTFNAIIVATMHNTIYVYDADRENPGPQGRTVLLWATWLGPPRRGGKDIDMWSTNDPEWGILGTPVVSRDRRTRFVVAWHDVGPAGLRFRLHALNLQNGAPGRPPVIVGDTACDPAHPPPRPSLFHPCFQK